MIKWAKKSLRLKLKEDSQSYRPEDPMFGLFGYHYVCTCPEGINIKWHGILLTETIGTCRYATNM